MILLDVISMNVKYAVKALVTSVSEQQGVILINYIHYVVQNVIVPGLSKKKSPAVPINFAR